MKAFTLRATVVTTGRPRTMSFDTDKFISEIQSRKAIWDLQSEEYANRDLKKKQWEEIVELFGGEELSNEEKKNSGHSLQKKWKNIRSCFSREVRRLKNTKSGSAASHKTPYIYYNQLLFLKNTVGNLNTESNIAEQEHLTNDQEPLGPYSRENIVGRKKKKTSDDGTSELLTTLNKCIETRKNKEDILEQDEERMFLMSLLSSFRAIPEHKKSAAKIQLISVIESFRSSTQNNIYPNTMWRNFNEYEYERGYFTPEAGRSTAPSQQSRPEAQHYYTLPTSTPSERERPESRFSTVTSNASQDSDILDLFEP